MSAPRRWRYETGTGHLARCRCGWPLWLEVRAVRGEATGAYIVMSCMPCALELFVAAVGTA